MAFRAKTTRPGPPEPTKPAIPEAARPFVEIGELNDPQHLQAEVAGIQARLRRSVRRDIHSHDDVKEAHHYVTEKLGEDHPCSIALRKLVLENEPVGVRVGRPLTHKGKAKNHRATLQSLVSNRQGERKIFLLIAEVLIDLLEKE